MRVFVSIDLDGLADAVADVQEPFRRPGLNPVDPEQAHITVKFLGDVDESELDDLRDALSGAVADADVGPFDLQFGGYGVFPSLDYVSVVWLGVREGGEAVARLHEAVESRTTALGFEPETHEFTPHVTLARMTDARSKDAVVETVTERDPDVGSLAVTDLRLTESTLTSDGPQYETVERFPL
ncbi:RNA 2',3'-cyclic phosphodiesterase [Halorarius litoreus]|uniref:RNA 2',3'-cyclic phosphodiesterase n=1 Tax=Halorarius litoreus TaxID=2962676 RepID=UPI0020CED6D2|nr:RNA 2',3'-cyclic phosphodiesterase [Halorarius litoreus]